MKFEYTTSYVPVSYDADNAKRGRLKETPIPSVPVPNSLLDNDEYKRLLQDMGDAGWELVTVQPLLRASHAVRNFFFYGGTGVSSSVTAGYYFFWKRAVE